MGVVSVFFRTPRKMGGVLWVCLVSNPKRGSETGKRKKTPNIGSPEANPLADAVFFGDRAPVKRQS